MVRPMVIAIAAAAALGAPARAQVDPKPPIEIAPKLEPKACNDRERLTLGDTHPVQGRSTTGERASDTLAAPTA